MGMAEWRGPRVEVGVCVRAVSTLMFRFDLINWSKLFWALELRSDWIKMALKEDYLVVVALSARWFGVKGLPGFWARRCSDKKWSGKSWTHPCKITEN